MPFCSQCGERLSPNANFCPNCGVSLAQVPPIASTSPIKREQPDDYPAFDSQKTASQEVASFPEYIGPQLKSPDALAELKPVSKPIHRTIATTISSVIFFTVGILGLCLGIFLLLLTASLLANAISLSFFNSLPYVSKVIGGSVNSLSLELLLILLAGFHFVAGNWLWQSLKRGGILGFTVAAFNFLICALVLVFFPVISTIAYIVIVVNTLLLLTVLLGWNSLHSASEVTE
jgi:lysylphosphatidylglycerol synthetase-like protein (DUF2156 family)